jgi:UDP-N-acetylglucosamine--N-acetylmuramyl-(pentapeptide) pyrophosphoryl-undecaprenol N-acetylglucosamine transferase
MNNILLAGGGTAGHIMPNIALLPELKKRFDNIYYTGGAGSMEEKICRRYDIPFYPTDVVKFRRDNMLKNFKVPFGLMRGIRGAKKLIRQLNPCVIFCKGGYASLPAAYAAKSLGIPVICHESDMTLGLANKLISSFATLTLTSYKETKVNGKHEFTGVPVRDNIGAGNRAKLIRELNLRDKPNLLVMGGSQGSKAINDTLLLALNTLTEKYNVIHISGKALGINRSGYYNVPYADNIEDYYALADVVVSRAGATACAELSYLNKKMLLIPLPKGASRGDQEADFRD